MKRMLCIVGGMNAGGAETFLMKLYRSLDRKNYQMDFAVAISDKGFYDDEIELLGGKIYHIVPKSKGIMENFLSIYNLVKVNHYSYVLRTSQHSLSALELLAAWIGGAKVRIFRSSNSNTTSGRRKDLLLHKLFLFMPKFFSNVKIAPSVVAAEYMFGEKCVNKGKVNLLHNAIDLSLFKYNEKWRNDIRTELKIQNNDIVIGHIGRFNQQKNHKFLLNIFSEFVKVHLNSKLILVGTGELENQIKKQAEELEIEDKVIFMGVRSDIPQILSAFDVFLFPSLYEGMPNTVIEAQATGVPCVISNQITKEVQISELVLFEALDSTSREWVQTIDKALSIGRKNVSTDLDKAGYSIKSVIPEFVNLTFEKY